MNILVLTSVYPQPDDGEQVATPTVRYYCRDWVAQGHRVLVIHNSTVFPSVYYLYYSLPNGIQKKLSSKLGHSFPTKESTTELSRIDEGVLVFRLPMKKNIPYSKCSKRIIQIQITRIMSLLNENSFLPDLIVAHWINPQYDLVRELKNQINAKTSIVFHNDCTEKTIKEFNLEHIHDVFDVIGCRSEQYSQYVMNRLSLIKKPFVCYSGVPDSLANIQEHALYENSLNKQNNEYIYVGRLVKYKNVDVIIRALSSAFNKTGFILHIVGAGSELDNLKRLSKELGVEEMVIFHGKKSRYEVFELMKNCICFTMVSDNETFGMVYVEAMLAGCITIASQNGGVDGLIVDGKNGFLIQQGNVTQLENLYKRINSMSQSLIVDIQKNAIKTALGFKESSVASNYLANVING